MSPLGSPQGCGCARKLSTSYYGGCWPDLAPAVLFSFGGASAARVVPEILVRRTLPRIVRRSILAPAGGVPMADAPMPTALPAGAVSAGSAVLA